MVAKVDGQPEDLPIVQTRQSGCWSTLRTLYHYDPVQQRLKAFQTTALRWMKQPLVELTLDIINRGSDWPFTERGERRKDQVWRA